MLTINRAVAWITLLSFATAPFQHAFAAKKLSKLPTSAASAPTENTISSTGDDASDTTSDAASDTLISPGFLLQLSSGTDTKLNGTFRVQVSGRIELPYNVSFSSKGMTLGKFRAQIAKSYASYVNGAPDVQARIKQKRYWVEALGVVAKPGTYLIREQAPLDEIISLAGGLTEDLTTGYVRIVQTPAGAKSKTSWIDLAEYYKGRHTEVPSWVGADRIFFQKERPDFAADQYDVEAATKIEILGEVRNPGELTYRKEADVYYYLIKTGGPTSASDLDKVEVIRTEKPSNERKRYSLGSLDDVKALQGGDILIVHPVRTTSFEKALTITSIITSIVTASLLAYVAIKQSQK